ncbi:hypothetical protein MuYL_2549 [Mucilaginibacter xinganensis]|uniref:Uncharacterized protein n=1 Tax=Mucilaginibacter xinganensis TaxID=1234841 RepID=A0A223NX82_9SPHI|nr:hypothetical protein MuYL_2549 [Mucilaginibacter xinganensis]
MRYFWHTAKLVILVQKLERTLEQEENNQQARAEEMPPAC